MASALGMENPLFRKYLAYGGVLIGKMLIMSLWTLRYRISTSVFANPEDLVGKGTKVKYDEPDVERVRRNHLNDLENILPFLILAPMYIATGPSEYWATIHLQVFTVTRIVHTLAYQLPIPQPSRAVAFLAGYIVNCSMVCQVVKAGIW